MGLQAGDRVVAVRNFGGFVREAIPAGATGRVVEAPWLAPARVEFELRDWWHGTRTVTVEIDPGEVAALR